MARIIRVQAMILGFTSKVHGRLPVPETRWILKCSYEKVAGGSCPTG